MSPHAAQLVDVACIGVIAGAGLASTILWNWAMRDRPRRQPEVSNVIRLHPVGFTPPPAIDVARHHSQRRET